MITVITTITLVLTYGTVVECKILGKLLLKQIAVTRKEQGNLRNALMLMSNEGALKI